MGCSLVPDPELPGQVTCPILSSLLPSPGLTTRRRPCGESSAGSHPSPFLAFQQPLMKLTSSAARHFTLLASVSRHWKFLNFFDSLTSLMIGSRLGPVLGPSLLTSCMTLSNLRVLCHL